MRKWIAGSPLHPALWLVSAGLWVAAGIGARALHPELGWWLPLLAGAGAVVAATVGAAQYRIQATDQVASAE